MDNRLPLDNFFPEVLREDPDFSVLIDLSSILLGRFESKIDDFNNLIDPDTCPIMYLPLLGRLVGYNYRYDILPDFNREIIKNIFKIYAMRGTDKAIIYAATYGDCKGYIGGDIFLPGTKPDRNLAEIDYPRDWIFRHNISIYSGGDKRANDGLYREGIMEISVERLNNEIRERVESVKPAGYVIRYRYLVNIDAEGTNHCIVRPDTFLDIFMYVDSVIRSTSSMWDRRGSRSVDFRHSGLKYKSLDINRIIEMYVDGRIILYSDKCPIYVWYTPKLTDIGRPTDLQLPVDSKMSSTDDCVTYCPVRYGHVENTSYNVAYNINSIRDMSYKYVVTSVDITISK